MRSTKLIINKNNILYNINQIKKYLGSEINIMPILKCYAYGTNLNYFPNIFNEFNYIAVAYLDEAITLRKNGFKNNILILYPLSKEEINIALKYNFILNGCNIFDLIKSNTKVKIHLEIETGMGRCGLLEKDVQSYINKLKNYKNITIDGIFTHLSSPSNEKFSLKQITKFKKVLNIIHKSNIYPNYIHVCSSGGLIYNSNNDFNMVRIGLLLYGYYPNDSLKKYLKLKPCMTLKTKISFIKTLEIGDTVGYNQNFIAKKRTIVATIPFGFGDGLLTLETGDAFVIIDNQQVKIIGICMDNMMLDVTNIANIFIGKDVYIWDNKNLTVEQLGIWCNNICNYEIISSISQRVPRVIK